MYYDAIIGGGNDSGHDPGRDNVVGTADDLRILDVLAGMAANNTTLINLNSGPFTALWNAYAAQTPGGVNFQINGDGSFPGGVNPATVIAQLIADAVATISSLSIVACNGFEGYAGWVQSVAPASYTNVALPATKEFDIVVGPPAGTAGGDYTFELCAIGGGPEYGRQTVTIHVPSAPVANAGPAVTLQCTSPAGTPVTLASSGTDADNDITTIEWLGAFAPASGYTP